MESDIPDILTPSEVAEVFRVPARTVITLLRKGELKGFKVGKVWRVRRVDMDAYLGRGE